MRRFCFDYREGKKKQQKAGGPLRQSKRRMGTEERGNSPIKETRAVDLLQARPANVLFPPERLLLGRAISGADS